jgi:DNA-binding helix-hairpin-helix protein with protein kinase domain
MFPSRTFSLAVGGLCCANVRGEFRTFKLIRQVGSDGAEGRVFHGQSGNVNCAIKIYSEEYRRQRNDEALLRKISLLASVGKAFLSTKAPLFAWPLGTVHAGNAPADLSPNKFVGFAMPMGEELTSLAGIAERAKKFGAPTLTQRHMIAYLIARGFAMIHLGAEVTGPGAATRVAFSVGDVNDSNIAVTADYIPFFLDCDSYIVRTSTEIFDHVYGRPEYMSPEYLAAKDKKARFIRAASDDNYGLAVLIFRLLNDWQRPYLYSGAKHLSMEVLIQEGRFPYASLGDRVIRDAEPTFAAYQSEINSRLKALFERAFLKGKLRPTAAEWVVALGEAAVARNDFAGMQTKTQAPRPVAPTPTPPRALPTAPPSLGSAIAWFIAAVVVVAGFVIWLLRH